MALYLQQTLLVGSSSRLEEDKLRHGDLLLPENESLEGDRHVIVNPHKPGSRSKSEKRDLRVVRKACEAMLRRIQTSKSDANFPKGFKLHQHDSLEERIENLRKKDGGPILMFNETADQAL